MTDEIRIDDLARAGPQRRPADGSRVRRDRSTTELTVDAVCEAAVDAHRAGRLRTRRLPRNGSACSCAEMDADDGAHRPRSHADVRRLRSATRPTGCGSATSCTATPRSSRSAIDATGHRDRPAPLGHHPPGQPVGRRHPVPVDAAVGVLRAGARTRRSRPGVDGVDPRWTRCQQPGRRCRPARRSSPPCTRWTPTTCTRRSSSAARLLELQPRVGGPGAPVARLLPRATTRPRTTRT